MTTGGARPRAVRSLAAGVPFLFACAAAMALDVQALWDFTQPALSEQRFTAALAGATADEALILRTQIARTHGLRRDFATAREVLATVAPALERASPEVQVRYHLELGRTVVSGVHPEADRTPANLETARRLYLQAHATAERARLDFLAIDALHMMAVIDPDPAQQLAWNERALALLERSDQADAKGWEGSLRHNVGYARFLQGRHDEALEQYRLSRAAYERQGRVRPMRIADWMIARTYRAQGRLAEAVALQLDLERAWAADGRPDPYVFEELALLYRALGDEARAEAYTRRFEAASR